MNYVWKVYMIIWSAKLGTPVMWRAFMEKTCTAFWLWAKRFLNHWAAKQTYTYLCLYPLISYFIEQAWPSIHSGVQTSIVKMCTMIKIKMAIAHLFSQVSILGQQADIAWHSLAWERMSCSTKHYALRQYFTRSWSSLPLLKHLPDLLVLFH